MHEQISQVRAVHPCVSSTPASIGAEESNADAEAPAAVWTAVATARAQAATTTAVRQAAAAVAVEQVVAAATTVAGTLATM